MKRTEHQKGFILLMVVALIPLLGMAAIVLTSNSRQILTNTRRATLKTHAQFACESGIAWIEKNTENALTNNKLLVLEIDNKDKINHLYHRTNLSGGKPINIHRYGQRRRQTFFLQTTTAIRIETLKKRSK